MNALDKTERNISRGTTASAKEMENFIATDSIPVDDGLRQKWKFWKQRRYIVMMLAWFGLIAKEALRTNLSVAILDMTENRTTTDCNGTEIYVQEFEWDMKARGFLLSCYSYGTIITILPGGILALKYGGTNIYGLSIATAAVISILTPFAAHMHFYLLVFFRIIEGSCEGLLNPSLELIYAVWTPLQERNFLVSTVSTGVYWGGFFGIAVSSSIAQYWGWRLVFYFTGSLSAVWYLFWFRFVKLNPGVDKKISPSELAYIQNYRRMRQEFNKQITSIPYLKIVTSLPLWVVILCNVTVYIGYLTLTTMIPTYIKDVLKHDTQDAGYLTFLPIGVKLLTIYTVSPIADLLINRKIFTTDVVRKLYICGGLTGAAISCFLIQLSVSTPAFLACMIAMQMCSGTVHTQYGVNLLDLAPSYSSILSSVSTLTRVTCSMFVPTLIGYLTQNKTSEEWNTVYSILAGMYLLAAVLYGLFGSGQLQHWAAEKEEIDSDSRVTEEDSTTHYPQQTTFLH